jgi:hypothetical protein
MSRVANQCFTEKKQDSFSELVLKYIFSGGVFGSQENNIAVEKTKVNVVGYTLKRLFLPYKSMVIAYPILKKVPVLLPFCWIARGFRLFSKKDRARFLAATRAASATDAASVAELGALYEYLHLEG